MKQLGVTPDVRGVMAGPAMIEGGGLGVVKPTDIGPSAKQVENGVIDILVENEQQAAEMAKKCRAKI